MGAHVDQLARLVERAIERDERDPQRLAALLERAQAALVTLEEDTRVLHRELDAALEKNMGDVPRLTREIRAHYAEAARLGAPLRRLRLHCDRLGVGRLQ